MLQIHGNLQNHGDLLDQKGPGPGLMCDCMDSSANSTWQLIQYYFCFHETDFDDHWITQTFLCHTCNHSTLTVSFCSAPTDTSSSTLVMIPTSPEVSVEGSLAASVTSSRSSSAFTEPCWSKLHFITTQHLQYAQSKPEGNLRYRYVGLLLRVCMGRHWVVAILHQLCRIEWHWFWANQGWLGRHNGLVPLLPLLSVAMSDLSLRLLRTQSPPGSTLHLFHTSSRRHMWGLFNTRRWFVN